MEWAHTVARNRDVGVKFREARRTYLEYRRAYRRWAEAFRTGDPAKLQSLEIERDVSARKASKACHEIGRALKVLAWWWTFGE